MSHPMETGLRKGQRVGEAVPAHHIKQVIAKHNDKVVLAAEWALPCRRTPSAVPFQRRCAGDKGQHRMDRQHWRQSQDEVVPGLSLRLAIVPVCGVC